MSSTVIYSAGLNADGTINSTDVTPAFSYTPIYKLITGLGGNNHEIEVITDIEFSEDCTSMLISGRSIKIPTGLTGRNLVTAHIAKTYRYDLSGGTWSAATSYNIGTFLDESNGCLLYTSDAADE